MIKQIKNKITYVLILIVLLSSLVYSDDCSTDPNDYILYDDMEDLATGYNSSFWTLTGTVLRETGIVHTGSSSIKSTAANSKIEKTSYTGMSAYSTNVTYDTWIYIPTGSDKQFVFYLYDGVRDNYILYEESVGGSNWVVQDDGLATSIDTGVAISFDQWVNIKLHYNGTHGIAYVDDVEIYDYTTSIDLSSLTMRGLYKTASNIAYWDDIRIYEGINCTPLSFNFIDPTPIDGYHTNTNETINISCETGNVTLWFDNNTIPNTMVLDNITSIANYTTNFSFADTYYYIASCNGGRFNSTIRTLVLDYVSPTITLLSDNFFASDNSTRISIFNTSTNMSFNLKDETALFGFEILVNYSNGTNYYTETNLTLSGTDINITRNLDISSFPYGNFTVDYYGSDSHTITKIKDYQVITNNKKIEFDTAEGNNIKIETNIDADITYYKERDSYRYDVSYKKPMFGSISDEKIFYLSSDKELTYLPDSNYKAHFVIWNSETKNGNWIDFEGIEGKPIITKKWGLFRGDYYEIKFITSDNNLRIKSVGGLNVNHVAYTFEIIGLYPSNPFINIANDTIWSYVGEYAVNESVNLTSYVNDILEDRCICEGCIISNNLCRIPFLFSSDKSGLLQIDLVNSTYEYGIDNCTNSYDIPTNDTAFNFTTKDEVSGDNILSNSTFEIFFSSNIYFLNGQKMIYSFCKYPEWYNQTGDIYATVRIGSYNPYTFNRYDILFNGSNYYAYILEESASNKKIVYKIINLNNEPVEDAIFLVYRNIDGISTLIFESKTDITGQTSLYQDTEYQYDYQIISTDYPIKNFSLKPSEQSSEPDYIIRLTTEDTSYFENSYSGIRYKHIPEDILFNNSGNWVNLSFVLEGNNLEEIGMKFTGHNYSCIPENCEDIVYNSNSGTAMISVKMDHVGIMNGAYWFKKIGEDRIYINDDKIKITNFLDKVRKSLIELLNDMKDETSPNIRTVIAASISIAFIGLGASFGLFGALLIIPTVLINIILSLPSIALINPFVGMIMTVFGITMFILFSMGRNV